MCALEFCNTMIVVKVHCNGLLLLSPTAFIDHVTITPVSLTLFYVFFETLVCMLQWFCFASYVILLFLIVQVYHQLGS